MKTNLAIFTICLALTAPIQAVSAADSHSNHSAHTAHIMVQPLEMPTETGQSAFAAIAEIVVLLNADPNTDWSSVSIDKLRKHLVDMNEVTLNATAEQSDANGMVMFKVSGTGRTLLAIQAMVPAHSAELDKMDEWQVGVNISAESVTMVVKSDDANTLAKVRALGFFGMMATGAHHQPHHWGMATGVMGGH